MEIKTEGWLTSLIEQAAAAAAVMGSILGYLKFKQYRADRRESRQERMRAREQRTEHELVGELSDGWQAIVTTLQTQVQDHKKEITENKMELAKLRRLIEDCRRREILANAKIAGLTARIDKMEQRTPGSGYQI